MRSDGGRWRVGVWRCLAAALPVLMLAACATPERRELPVPVRLSIAASERLNPTEQGRASPVVVRVYEMVASSYFQGADFFTLLGDLDKAKNEEVKDVQEYVLMPGEVRVVRRKADLNTRYLGVVAGYRDLQGSAWRSLVAVSPPHRAGRLWSSDTSPEQKYRIAVGEKAIAIEEVAE